MAAADLIQQGSDHVHVGGKANAPTDVYAGFLIADFIYKEPDEDKRKKALEYLNEAILMECEFCNKVQMSKTRCINGHYICDECHTRGLNKVIDICLNVKSINPIEIINKIMKEDFCVIKMQKEIHLKK